MWEHRMFDGTHGYMAGSHLGGLPSTAADDVLLAAFDEVESGLIVVGQDFEVEFINRAFYRMWALAPLSGGDRYRLSSIVEHGRKTGLFFTDPASLEDYVQQRK